MNEKTDSISYTESYSLVPIISIIGIPSMNPVNVTVDSIKLQRQISTLSLNYKLEHGKLPGFDTTWNED